MALLYLRAITAVLLLAVAAAGAGRWIPRLLSKNCSLLDQAALVLSGGLGILGTVLFAIGQLVFSHAVILVVLVVAGVFGLSPVGRFLRAFVALFQSRRVSGIPATVIGAILLVSAVAGLAEITGGWGSDAVAYHLFGPKTWLRDGIVRPVPDNCLTAFPQTTEVLFAAEMSVGGNRAPGFSAVLTTAVFLLVIAAIAVRCGLGDNGTWWSAALAITMPALYAGSHTGFIDAFYAALVLAALRIALDARTPGQFALLGLFCGLAMGTKYTGLLAFPTLMVATLIAGWSFFRPAKTSDLLRGLMTTTTVACVAAAPFYLRNLILLGSPIYPPPVALLRFFHAKYVTLEMLTQMQAFLWQRGAGLGRGTAAYLLLPYNLTYHTSNFHGAGGIGLAPLAFLPFAMARAPRERTTLVLIVFAWLTTTIWFIQQESRYLIPAYGALAISAALGWRWVTLNAGRLASLLATAVVALSVCYGCFMIASARQSEMHAVVSRSYAEQFRRERTPFFQSFDYLNSTASVRKVLILDRSVMPYNLDLEYVKPIGTWGERVLPDIADSTAALGSIKALGVSHVLDVQSEVATFQVPRNYPGLTLILALPNQRIYRVGD